MIFIGSSLTLVFGVLNLIAALPAQKLWCVGSGSIAGGRVSRKPPGSGSEAARQSHAMRPAPVGLSRAGCQVAVVVDTFADARLNDVQNLAEEMEDEIEHDSDSEDVKGFRGWNYVLEACEEEVCRRRCNLSYRCLSS